MDDKTHGSALSSQPSSSMELYLQRLHSSLDGAPLAQEAAGGIARERVRMLEAEDPRLSAPEAGAEQLVDRGEVIKLYRTTMDALRTQGDEKEPEQTGL